MTVKPYQFGKDKVHPLDPVKAPWSGPRGYTTSIPEEVAAYKASLHRRQKPIPRSEAKVIRVKRRSSSNQFFSRIWTKIRAHFIAVGNDMFPRQTAQNPNGDVKRPLILATLCCLRSEI
jgi:hypothetical protein